GSRAPRGAARAGRSQGGIREEQETAHERRLGQSFRQQAIRPALGRQRVTISKRRHGVGKIIEFYWDLGSTNSYFALHLIKPVAKKHGATVVPHPFNLGYVFRKQNYVLMEEP